MYYPAGMPHELVMEQIDVAYKAALMAQMLGGLDMSQDDNKQVVIKPHYKTTVSEGLYPTGQEEVGEVKASGFQWAIPKLWNILTGGKNRFISVTEECGTGQFLPEVRYYIWREDKKLFLRYW